MGREFVLHRPPAPAFIERRAQPDEALALALLGEDDACHEAEVAVDRQWEAAGAVAEVVSDDRKAPRVAVTGPRAYKRREGDGDLGDPAVALDLRLGLPVAVPGDVLHPRVVGPAGRGYRELAVEAVADADEYLDAVAAGEAYVVASGALAEVGDVGVMRRHLDMEGLVRPVEAHFGGLVLELAGAQGHGERLFGANAREGRAFGVVRDDEGDVVRAGDLPGPLPLPEQGALDADFAEGAFGVGPATRGLGGGLRRIDPPAGVGDGLWREELLRNAVGAVEKVGDVGLHGVPVSGEAREVFEHRLRARAVDVLAPVAQDVVGLEGRVPCQAGVDVVGDAELYVAEVLARGILRPPDRHLCLEADQAQVRVGARLVGEDVPDGEEVLYPENVEMVAIDAHRRTPQPLAQQFHRRAVDGAGGVA